MICSTVRNAGDTTEGPSPRPGLSRRRALRRCLVDDHEVVSRGLTDLLDAEPDITMAGDAGSVEQALTRGPALRPHVAVLDVRLPAGGGTSLVWRVPVADE